MNILIITPSYFPDHGGTEEVIFRLVKSLKNDHTVKILTIRWNIIGFKKYEKIDGVDVFRARVTYKKGLKYLSRHISLFFSGLKLNIRYKFDLIHVFHTYSVGGAGFLLKKLLKVPLINTLAGWDTYDPVKKIPPQHLFIVRGLMNAADIVTAPSTHLASAGKKQGCKKDISVIPHGTNMHQKVNNISISIHKKYHLDKNLRIIISVQRLVQRKGLKYLLNAIPDISEHNSDIIFIIIGQGREEQNLKKLASELNILRYLIFTGFVPDEELPSYYNAADLFVLPTNYEGFGLVYIDALTFGIPIVTTDSGGSRDIVNKNNGILVPVKDSKKLAHAVVEALDKKWDTEKIKIDSEKYKWEKITAQYKKLYCSITKN